MSVMKTDDRFDQIQLWIKNNSSCIKDEERFHYCIQSLATQEISHQNHVNSGIKATYLSIQEAEKVQVKEIASQLLSVPFTK